MPDTLQASGGDDYDTAAADDTALYKVTGPGLKKQKASAGKGGVAVRNHPLFT